MSRRRKPRPCWKPPTPPAPPSPTKDSVPNDQWRSISWALGDTVADAFWFWARLTAAPQEAMVQAEAILSLLPEDSKRGRQLEALHTYQVSVPVRLKAYLDAIETEQNTVGGDLRRAEALERFVSHCRFTGQWPQEIE